MLRDDRNGRFVVLSKEDHVITCEGVVLEAAAKKPKKEFAYAGIFDDVCQLACFTLYILRDKWVTVISRADNVLPT